MSSARSSNSSELEDFVPFNVPMNPDGFTDIAEEQLGETEEVKQECLQKLREMIRDRNVGGITTDNVLLRFLRSRKFNVQRSFDAFQNYVTQRINLHKRLMNLKTETFRLSLRTNTFSFLPYRDSEGRMIFLGKSGIWSPKICSSEVMLLTWIVLAHYASEKQSSQVVGVVPIFDLDVLPVTYIPHIMYHAWTMLHFLFNCLPLRYYAVHFINEPFLLRHILRLLDPLIPGKIKRKMVFHGKNRDRFFQQLDPVIMPYEFGGSLGPLSNDDQIEEMVEYFIKMKAEQRHFIRRPSNNNNSL